MLRLTVTPTANGKHHVGRLEIDGVDISHYVTNVRLSGNPSDWRLSLDMILGKGQMDEVEVVLPDDALESVRATVITKNGPVEVIAPRRKEALELARSAA